MNQNKPLTVRDLKQALDMAAPDDIVLVEGWCCTAPASSVRLREGEVELERQSQTFHSCGAWS